MTIKEKIIEQLSKNNLTIIQLCERISDVDRDTISTTIVRMKKNKLIKVEIRMVDLVYMN